MMEFRRITNLPPYVFSVIDRLKVEGRRRGEDIIDLGFGNPDIPSPDIAVEKLAEAVRNPRNHRYSLSRGIPKLRSAVADLYLRRFGVELDPETQVVNTIGAKEGLSHLMWVLLQPGDAVLGAGALVSDPPLRAALRRSGDPQHAPGDRRRPRRSAPPTLGVLVAQASGHPPVVPAQSDHHLRGPGLHATRRGLRPGARGARRPRLRLCRHRLRRLPARPPSCRRPAPSTWPWEFYSLTKSFSMAGWRVAFMAGNAEVVAALAKLKSYLDYGTFQPIQIAATVTLNEAADYPKLVNETYQSRRDSLCDGLERIGWHVDPPQGTMFVWAPIPEAYRHMDSVEFASFLVTEAGRGHLAGWWVRARGRRVCPLRSHRERAAHRPGGPQPAQGPARPRLRFRCASAS